MSIGGSTPEKELAALVAPTLVPAITAAEREGRIEKARNLIRAAGADALLIGRGASLDYFAGIAGGASERLMALLVPVSGKPVLIGPYFEAGSMQAALEIEADLRLWQEEESPFTLVGSTMREKGLRKLAIDPDMAFAMVHALGRDAGCEILDGGPVVGGCRMIKTSAEIAILQQAMNMTLTVQKAVARIIAEGMAADDIVQFIDAAHRKLGSAGSSFCIVQFGRGTAFPHGLPGVQRVKQNDLVLVDTGCWLHGYSSDMTRTYSFGTPTDEQRRIWDIEKQAEQTAFDAVKIGATCESVDAAVRALLVRHGLGPDYQLPGLPHRTGHGIGMSIHEGPYIVRGDKTVLAPGMCFSDEPMIVVPDSFGVRLEDHIHVTESGPAWFTEPQQSITEV